MRITLCYQSFKLFHLLLSLHFYDAFIPDFSDRDGIRIFEISTIEIFFIFENF